MGGAARRYSGGCHLPKDWRELPGTSIGTWAPGAAIEQAGKRSRQGQGAEAMACRGRTVRDDGVGGENYPKPILTGLLSHAPNPPDPLDFTERWLSGLKYSLAKGA